MVHIKIYGCCIPIYVDLHTQGFGLRPSTAEIVFQTFYSILHNYFLFTFLYLNFHITTLHLGAWFNSTESCWKGLPAYHHSMCAALFVLLLCWKGGLSLLLCATSAICKTFYWVSLILWFSRKQFNEQNQENIFLWHRAIQLSLNYPLENSPWQQNKIITILPP